jgi:molybdenum cofactor cytidylyltransferase
VVTGHEPPAVEVALAGLAVAFVANPDHAQGLSSSLRAGLRAVPDDVEGVVVLLGDMPGITAAIVDRLISAFRPGSIVVPMSRGQRGNPVVWPRRFFADLMAVAGDRGGRDIVEANRDSVVEIAIGPAAALDVDTPEALAAAGGLASG